MNMLTGSPSRNATTVGMPWLRTACRRALPTPFASTSILASVNAISMCDASDYAVLVSGADSAGTAGVWSTRLGSGVGAPPGVWLPLTLLMVLQVAPTDTKRRALQRVWGTIAGAVFAAVVATAFQGTWVVLAVGIELDDVRVSLPPGRHVAAAERGAPPRVDRQALDHHPRQFPTQPVKLRPGREIGRAHV